MAQKSLPELNKVGTSMVWYTTFFYKYYKWLSSQNLYLLYFFNKLFVYIDFIFSKLYWLEFYGVNLYIVNKPKVKSFLRKHRFYRPLTSYLVNVGVQFSMINIYYKTTLETFQELNKSKNSEEIFIKTPKLVEDKLFKTFYNLK